jgi:hypothetical protein
MVEMASVWDLDLKVDSYQVKFKHSRDRYKPSTLTKKEFVLLARRISYHFSIFRKILLMEHASIN